MKGKLVREAMFDYKAVSKTPSLKMANLDNREFVTRRVQLAPIPSIRNRGPRECGIHRLGNSSMSRLVQQAPISRNPRAKGIPLPPPPLLPPFNHPLLPHNPIAHQHNPTHFTPNHASPSQPPDQPHQSLKDLILRIRRPVSGQVLQMPFPVPLILYVHRQHIQHQLLDVARLHGPHASILLPKRWPVREKPLQ